MEKKIPHCRLSVIRTLIDEGKVKTTHSARQGANVLGIDYQGMLAVVKALTPADFHKSMTTYGDHTAWQDVYRPRTPAGTLYVKLMVVDDVLIVSFKEL